MSNTVNVASGIAMASQGVSVTQLLSLLFLGVLPIAFMCTTSYLKISIVLAVLRNALGGGQIPSQALSGVLALVISLFTMFPVMEECFKSYVNFENQTANDSKGNEKVTQRSKSVNEQDSVLLFIERAKAGTSPLLNFLRLNTNPRERSFFFALDQKRAQRKSALSGKEHSEEHKTEYAAEHTTELQADHGAGHLKSDDAIKIPCMGMTGKELEICLEEHEGIHSLIISFVMSELRSACTIGVYLFLPFLVIDLIVSTILTGLGMMMVSPVTISLPLKLLLFVLSDGWRALTESLILAYRM